MVTRPGKELRQKKYPVDVYWEDNGTKFAGLNTLTTSQVCLDDKTNRPDSHSSRATTSYA